ncbi:acetyl-/propionyl-CoA carboxylase subunit alpha [Kocuria rosea subsp. polaris]|uniref:biotin carboxylase n=1 Tax=Kocuria rosea subsp. polaris TaxID=136273 RepID=A0A0W8INS3_KOCRO|nr:biotin carboxylase N-terminal domain-containing protein [Kocuria polaris]KUG61621.1 acetyl-/propionyl-CoA carboxylase subunit alpha [Kocuria polaris]
MRKILIANRGEIAVRVVHACAEAGLESVAVYADPDADAPHVALADEAYALEGTSATETYLDGDEVLAIALRCGADAVHPGYGFLSENAGFARAVIEAGLTWIGPSPETIVLLGDKVAAREIARRAGAPLVPGSDGPVESAEEARAFAQEHGLPVIVKAAHGGGGRGMRVVRELDQVEDAFRSAAREAQSAFGRGECFVERFLDRPRHVEAQVVADAHGHVVVLGTRDCSLQRRHQKLVEEAPAPFLTDDQRERIAAAAEGIFREAGYVGVGTAEFLVAPDGLISFLEVNTRLQVEHPITEEVYGVDLVRAQLTVAAGDPLPVLETPAARGHAFEFRINAEDPGRGFLPSGGTVEAVDTPTGPGVRVDSGVRRGTRVATTFDSLLLKLVVSAPDRAQALVRARTALRELQVHGVATTVPFHRAVLDAPAFTGDDELGVWTTWIEEEFADRLAPDAGYARADEQGRTRFTVDVDGRRLRIGIPDALAAALGSAPAADASPAGAEPADDGAVTAPFAGTLVSWLVSEQDEVAAGQDVAVLEAMKTETRVSAPRAGTVRELVVGPGDAVQADQVLARLS